MATDRVRAEAVAEQVYANAGLKLRARRWHDDPVLAHQAAYAYKPVGKFLSSSCYEYAPPEICWAPEEAVPGYSSSGHGARWMVHQLTQRLTTLLGVNPRYPEAGCCFAPSGRWQEPLRRELNRSCGAAWFSLEAADFSEQPLWCLYDARGRLNNTIDSAVQFPGAGLSIYVIQGVEVGEWVKRPEKLTADNVRAEHNAEVRRVMVERVGWLKYLTMAGARVRDRRIDEVCNAEECLVELLQFDEVKLVCGYRDKGEVVKLYAMDVPSDTRTCEQAQAYLSCGLAKRTISAS